MEVVFVTSINSLAEEGGGVQRCTREYLNILKSTGCVADIISFSSDRNLFTRAKRKVLRRPYNHIIAPQTVAEILNKIERDSPDWIFFNHCDGLPAVRDIYHAAKASKTRLGFFSHGLDSTDYLHYQDQDNHFSKHTYSRHSEWHLGAQLFSERSMLKLVDLTICLAPTDVEIHRWLGARKVVHLPRSVTPSALPWKPTEGRFGTISTLVHSPNHHGIVEFCKALESFPGQAPSIRLVGRPEHIGKELSDRFSCIDYLGGLSDAELSEEAQTWSGFINPIFSYPRGASTKLSVPLEWQIPIFSTRAGARGYEWNENHLPLFDTPEELALSVKEACESKKLTELQQAAAQISNNSPSISQVSETLKRLIS